MRIRFYNLWNKFNSLSGNEVKYVSHSVFDTIKPDILINPKFKFFGLKILGFSLYLYFDDSIHLK